MVSMRCACLLSVGIHCLVVVMSCMRRLKSVELDTEPCGCLLGVFSYG